MYSSEVLERVGGGGFLGELCMVSGAKEASANSSPTPRPRLDITSLCNNIGVRMLSIVPYSSAGKATLFFDVSVPILSV